MEALNVVQARLQRTKKLHVREARSPRGRALHSITHGTLLTQFATSILS